MKTISAVVSVFCSVNFWQKTETAAEIVFMRTQSARRQLFKSSCRQNLHEELMFMKKVSLCRQTGRFQYWFSDSQIECRVTLVCRDNFHGTSLSQNF
jgi:hypothetical protein